jgi:hypothetical protein
MEWSSEALNIGQYEKINNIYDWPIALKNLLQGHVTRTNF